MANLRATALRAVLPRGGEPFARQRAKGFLLILSLSVGCF